MNLLNEITIKNLKKNKKRTIVTMIGIALSVALICAITSFVASFQKAIVNREIKTGGNYHIYVQNITQENRKYLENNVKVQEIGYVEEIGYAKIEGYQNENKPYAYIEAMDEKSLNNMGLILTEGKMPESENEILIPEHLATNGKVEYKIGDKITFEIGNRYIDGYKLGQNNPYFTDEDLKARNEANQEKPEEYEEEKQEEFIPNKTKEYIVVGKVERPNFEEYSAPGYTMITKLENTNETEEIEMLILLKKPAETYKFVEYIENELKIDKTYIKTNDALLQYLGVFKSSRTTDFITTLAAIVIVIILVTSAFVICNSFNISLTEKTKELGMLASIGATSKQIRKSIFFEGFLLAIISIPLGIVVGIMAIGIVLAIVNGILNSGNTPIIDNFNLSLVISWTAIAIAVAVSILMIVLSLIRPSVRAGRISPIDAIREKTDIKLSNRQMKKQLKDGNKTKEYKITKKLFGIEGVIARKNFKRSKKKYRTTIFSIFLSIVLFISMNSIIENMFKVSSLEIQEREYNINIYSGEREEEEIQEYFNKIEKLDGIKDSAVIKTLIMDGNEAIFNEKEYVNGTNILIYALGEKGYQNYIKTLGLKYENIKDKAILYDTRVRNIKEEGKDGVKRVEYNILNIKEGDMLELTENKRYYTTEEKQKQETELGSNQEQIEKIKIGLRTTTLPLDGLFRNSINPVLIVSDEYIRKFEEAYISSMCINAVNPSNLEAEIIKLNPSNKGNVFNLEEQVRAENNMQLIISIFLYGFIVVISIIGITNIFNTVTTNMALRTREFAILKSIGMANKEFRKMINYESFIYGIKSLLLGLPVGILLSYFIYRVTGTVYETEYRLPISAIIISIIFVFAIIFITMQYSVKKSKNQNIIETIRKENI